jgi:transcriptional regulator with XRE-family HTH domain
MAIQQKIQQMMTQYGYSPTQLADQLGIPRSSISHLMSGRNKPSLEFVLKVLHRFPETNLYEFLDLPQPDQQPNNAPATTEMSTHWSLFDIEHSGQTEKLNEHKAASNQVIPLSIPTSKLQQPIRVVFFYGDGTFEAFENSAQQ